MNLLAPDLGKDVVAKTAAPEQREESRMRRVLKGFWWMFDLALGVKAHGAENEDEEHFRSWGP